MKTKPNPIISDLEPVRRQLERWRRTRKHRDRIPEALWSAITQVARTHGVSRVARVLRVQYYALRDRAKAAPVPRPKPASDPFVEIPLTTPTSPVGCVVELEDRSGSKMTLRLAPPNGMDAVALVEAFWRRKG